MILSISHKGYPICHTSYTNIKVIIIYYYHMVTNEELVLTQERKSFLSQFIRMYIHVQGSGKCLVMETWIHASEYVLSWCSALEQCPVSFYFGLVAEFKEADWWSGFCNILLAPPRSGNIYSNTTCILIMVPHCGWAMGHGGLCPLSGP